MGKLEGKTVVVTGSSRGIGAEIAKLLASEGGRVICVARTLREGEHPLEGSLERTVNQIKDDGGEATPRGRGHLQAGSLRGPDADGA